MNASPQGAATPRMLTAGQARRVIEEALEHDVFGSAAQLAFFFLLAVFPFVLLLATLLPYFSQPEALEKIMSWIQPVVPAQVWDLVRGNLHTMLTYKRQGLLSLSVLALLWSASSGFLAIMQGLNIAYRVRETRPFWKSRLMAMALTVLLGQLVLLSILLLLFGEKLGLWAAGHLGLSVYFWRPVRWLVVLLSLMISLDIIYYAAPNVSHRWRWLSPGAVLATPAWIAMSVGLRYYLWRFGRYEATYGALTAMIMLMLWFYASGVVLLLGGELNSELEWAARGKPEHPV